MAVVTLGAHILDVLARPVESIPDGQDTVVVDEIRVTAAGAAAGTAVALARHGNDVVSVGAGGDDDLGDLLVPAMERNGVDERGLVRANAGRSSASILPMGPDGGRPSVHVPGASLTGRAGAVGPGLLAGADSVHLGGPDGTCGLDDPAVIERLAQARGTGTVVTMGL